MAVGLVAGGWFASSIISKLINGLIDYAKDQKHIQLGLKDELKRLDKAVPKIQAVVDAVDQGLIREKNPPLEKWLWQLRDVAVQAEDVMDEMEYNSVKEKRDAGKDTVSKTVLNFKIILERAITNDPTLKRLKKAVKEIDEVAKDVGVFYMVVQDLVKNRKMMMKTAMNSRETSSIFNVEIFGRQKEKEDIIKKLLNPEGDAKGTNFAVLPIVGAGGVGKTTLAQFVYNDPAVEKYFELRMWVCISNNFDVVLHTKKLYESALRTKADFNSLDLIHNNLKEKLSGNRFLIVFDDAWNDDDGSGWEKLFAPLKSGKSGSMVLLTTRKETVAQLAGVAAPNRIDSVFLKGLMEVDMWDLFMRCAFGDKDPNCYKELVAIGKGIVKKLKGSPLAAKSVGGIPSSNLDDEYWESILESELWNLTDEQDNLGDQQNSIMPALNLSYQHLPPKLKPCFSFCSIFPQDHIFIKDDLVCMWIALNLVPPDVDGTKRPEYRGSQYFDDMLKRSIFAPADRIFFASDHLNNGAYADAYHANDLHHLKEDQYLRGYVMHDLMHDLSRFVSQGECLRISTDKPVSIPRTIRHLYAHVRDPCKLSISGLKNIRTIILHIDECDHPNLNHIVSEMLKGMGSLRLLTLISHNLSEFPESASDLVHLRYLNLSTSSVRSLPKSMSKLCLLETMVYNIPELSKEVQADTPQKKEVQADVLSKLTNLRHLIAPGWCLATIAGIGRLTSLQEFSFYVEKKGGSKISELRDLRQLRHLSISINDHACSHQEAIQANLRNIVSIRGLSLACKEDDGYEEVLNSLEPRKGLRELSIINMARRPPIWLKTQNLSKLVYLSISRGKLEHLTGLEELPLLKDVDVYDLSALKSISHQCNEVFELGMFPSLEMLYLANMPALEEWFMAGQPITWMQCFKKLTVALCTNLRVLPRLPVSLKELRLRYIGIVALPALWEDRSSESGSLASLVHLEISNCPHLASLAEGLFQNPKKFADLQNLTIYECVELTNLPPGGFSNFISLKNLVLKQCPKIEGQLMQEYFLPSSLETLCISSCGNIDVTLSKALQHVHSIFSLELYDCANIASLPPKEVFNRWKCLREITIKKCPELTSLEGLDGLISVERLVIGKCPKLVLELPSPSVVNEDENENIQTPPEPRIEGSNWYASCSRRASTFLYGLCILCSLFKVILRILMSKLSRSATIQLPPTEENHLSSVSDLSIDDPSLLSIEPIRSLSSVTKLAFQNCSEFQSLPELPLFPIEMLVLNKCRPELMRRCDTSGPDWPKISHIRHVKKYEIDPTKLYPSYKQYMKHKHQIHSQNAKDYSACKRDI